MNKEIFKEGGNSENIEQEISNLIKEMQDKYGKFFDELSPGDQMTWQELIRFANVEKNQSLKQKEVLLESLKSFVNFLKSEF